MPLNRLAYPRRFFNNVFIYPLNELFYFFTIRRRASLSLITLQLLPPNVCLRVFAIFNLPSFIRLYKNCSILPTFLRLQFFLSHLRLPTRRRFSFFSDRIPARARPCFGGHLSVRRVLVFDTSYTPFL